MQLARFPHISILVLGLTIAIHGRQPHCAAAPQSQPDWSPALAALLDRYRDGDYASVQSECVRLLRSTLERDLRRDVRTLSAMTLLRMPERGDRIAGRDLLAELDRDDPVIGQRPECLLALGVGLMGLHETGSALHNIALAAEVFAAAQNHARTAEAYYELAAAWAGHTEWELTPKRFGIVLPSDPRQFMQIRLEQIEAVRARAAGIPVGHQAADRVDLVLAGVLLNSDADTPRGVAILDRLASSAVVTELVGQALERLARIRADEKEWTRAVALYTRLADAGLGELSIVARRRANEITSPRIELDLPGGAAPGEAIAAAIRARNIESLDFEVRRFDVAKYLEKYQGRLIEAQFPDEGAVVHARRIAAVAATQHDWTRTVSTLKLDAGAYVVLARGRVAGQPQRTVKKLLVVGDLQATMFVGDGRAVVWALTADGQPLAGDVSARFWMHATTFVAKRRPLTDGVAAFPLPPESRQPDRRWVCLVSRGEDLALCRGRLAPRNVNPTGGAAVALLTNGLFFNAGDTLQLKGILLPPRGVDPSALAGKSVRIDVLDVAEKLIVSQRATVSGFGVFQTRIPITRDLANGSFHIVARLDDLVLPNVKRPTAFRVLPAERSDARLTITLPRVLDSRYGALSGRISAGVAGGTPTADQPIVVDIMALQLPDREQGRGARLLAPYRVAWQLDSNGRFDFSVPFQDLGLDGRYAIVRMKATLIKWDSLASGDHAMALLAPEPVQLWLSLQPDPPSTQSDAVVSIDVYDFADLTEGRLPSLSVRRDGKEIAKPRVSLNASGATAAVWRPEQSGKYELEAEVQLRNGESATARKTVTVVDRAAPADSTAPLSSDVRFAGEREKRVLEIEASWDASRPLLAILDDGAPLAAVSWDAARGARRASLSIGRPREYAVQVVFASTTPGGVELVSVSDIRSADDHANSLSIELDRTDILPGESVSARISLTDPQDRPIVADLTLRLVDLRQHGFDPVWAIFGDESESADIVSGLNVVSSRQPQEEQSPPDTVRYLSRTFKKALLENDNVWLWSGVLNGDPAQVHVPLANRPSRYRLIAVARTADGTTFTNSITLSSEYQLQARLDAPAHLLVGDRAVLIVALTNHSVQERKAHVETAPGSTLTSLGANAVDLTLAPGESRSLSFAVEASGTGRSEIVVTIDSAGRVQRLTAGCLVEPDSGVMLQLSGSRFGNSRQTLSLPEGSVWIPGENTRLRLQRSLTDVVVDAADAWINEPVESTAWQVLRLSWADALLRIRPQFADDALREVLALTDVNLIGAARLRQSGAATLREFHADAVQRLLAARRPDGGWGSWGVHLPQVVPSVAAVLALETAAADPEISSRLLISSAWLRGRMASLSGSAGSSRTDRIALGSVLRALAPGARSNAAFGQKWALAADGLKRLHRQLSPAGRCELAAALARVGRTDEADRLLGETQPLSRSDRVRLNIALLERGEQAAADRLLNERRGANWGDPFLTAEALLALARHSSEFSDRSAAGVVRITVAGDDIAEIALDDATASRIVPLDPTTRAIDIHHQGGGQICALWSGRVSRPPTPNAAIRVQRKFVLLTPERTADGRIAWRPKPIPGNVVIMAAGQRLLVRESWEFAEPAERIEWTQPLPGGFIPLRKAAEEASLGTLHDRSADLITWISAGIDPGLHLREYTLVAARPGTYLFPDPVIRVQGVAWPVQPPVRTRLTVTP